MSLLDSKKYISSSLVAIGFLPQYLKISSKISKRPLMYGYEYDTGRLMSVFGIFVEAISLLSLSYLTLYNAECNNDAQKLYYLTTPIILYLLPKILIKNTLNMFSAYSQGFFMMHILAGLILAFLSATAKCLRTLHSIDNVHLLHALAIVVCLITLISTYMTHEYKEIEHMNSNTKSGTLLGVTLTFLFSMIFEIGFLFIPHSTTLNDSSSSDDDTRIGNISLTVITTLIWIVLACVYIMLPNSNPNILRKVVKSE